MMAHHERLILRPRRPVGSHRTPLTDGAAEAEGWPSLRSESSRPQRHHLCATHGLSLATPTEGTGLRERDHVLAKAAGLTGGRCLEAVAYQAAQLAR